MLALIPIKSHSSGAPRKAWLPIGGVPMWWQSVAYARQEGCTPLVITDDAGVRRQCADMEVETLADDLPDAAGDMLHTLRLALAARPQEQLFALLQPTSPLRAPGMLIEMARRARPLAQGGGRVCLFTATPGKAQGVIRGEALDAPRRQECSEAHLILPFDGSICVFSRAHLEAHGTLFSGGLTPMPQPSPACSLQVDTMADVLALRQLAAAQGPRGLLPTSAEWSVCIVANKPDWAYDWAPALDAMSLIIRINDMGSLDSGRTGRSTDIAYILPGLLYMRNPAERQHAEALRAAHRIIWGRQTNAGYGGEAVLRRHGVGGVPTCCPEPAIARACLGLTTFYEALLWARRAYPGAHIFALGDKSTLIRAREHARTAEREDALTAAEAESNLFHWLN